jgi:hypothetical protein
MIPANGNAMFVVPCGILLIPMGNARVVERFLSIRNAVSVVAVAGK